MPRPTLEDSIKTGLLTPAGLAKILGISPPTVRKMISLGRLKTVPKHFSKERVIPATEAVAAIAILGHETSPPILLIAARFYVARRMAEGKPLSPDEIPNQVKEAILAASFQPPVIAD